ncbi:ribose 5-phosphate isomerase B [Desulfovibrio sp. OttesenSCG-928-C06]|nr:ribose 5-phosphate isomerase B [Desulfovibrio sp. OttesenSCG-928-C06]
MPQNNKTIFIGSDHAGFSVKADLIEYLGELGFKVEDCGAYSAERFDYPLAAQKVCAGVLESKAKGILVCGSGIGMSIAANRFKGIRAALCTHEFHARACRNHNNANIICLGERLTAPAMCRELVKIFLESEFEGGRHEQRVELIEKF